MFSREAIEGVILKLKSLTNNKSDFYSVIDLMCILYDLSNDDNARTLCNQSLVEEVELSEDKRILRLMTFIKNNYKGVLRLGDVAAKFGFSEVSFSRFIKETRKNLVEYINDLRLGLASNLLVYSNNSIAEICYECGFCNLSNFNRIFKSPKGCSPKEFRENYMKVRKLI